MKLSIITVCLNNCEGLRKTAESLSAQTCQDFEWIVIDGGSKDGSVEFLKTFQRQPDFLSSEPDNGVYNGMNKGISRAHGEYLQFLNAGDILTDNCVVEYVLPQLKGEDVVYGDIRFQWSDHIEEFCYPDRLTKHYLVNRSLGHPSSFIKAELLKAEGYREDFRIVSDWHRFLQWFLAEKSFRHINRFICDFDQTGISVLNTERLQKEQRQVLDELLGSAFQREDAFRISVIIPVYNVEKYLRQTLDSVISQTYRNIEIVCVDDGSTDGSWSILQEYAQKDDRVKVYQQSNQGAFMAKKACVAHTTGDYILSLDADDWLEKTTCQCVADRIAERPDTDILQYGVKVEADVSMVNEEYNFNKWFTIENSIILGNAELLSACYEQRIIPWNIASKAIRGTILRSAYQAHPDVCYNYLDDFMVNFYVMALSREWRKLNQQLYHYRLGSGMTTVNSERHLTLQDFSASLGYLDAFRYLCDWVEKNYEDNQRILEVLHKSTFDYVFDEPFAYIHNRMDEAQLPDSYSLLISQRLGAEATLLGFSRKLRVRESENLTRIVRAEKKLRKYRALTKWLAVLSGLLLLVVVLLLLCVIF